MLNEMAMTSDLDAQIKSLVLGGQFELPWHTSDEKIFRASLELFAEYGFHGTSTRAIAMRANMSPGALYSHYQSKLDILYRIIRMTHEVMVREMQVTMTYSSDPIERLRALVKCHVRYHAELYIASRVANYEMRCLEPEQFENIVVLRRLAESMFSDTLMMAVATDALKVDDVDIATIMICSLGLDVSRWYKPNRGLTPEDLANYYSEHVINMFSER
jgi:AcrR family transcriptional regulator